MKESVRCIIGSLKEKKNGSITNLGESNANIYNKFKREIVPHEILCFNSNFDICNRSQILFLLDRPFKLSSCIIECF